MSKELFERIENYRRLSFDSDDLDAIDLLTDCQQRIAELERETCSAEHDTALSEYEVARLEQENARFKQRIEVDAAAIAAHEARIEELEQQLRLEKQLLAAVKHTVVATIGGVDCEGYPTSEINYLQRLRILVEKEQELEANEQGTD